MSTIWLVKSFFCFCFFCIFFHLYFVYNCWRLQVNQTNWSSSINSALTCVFSSLSWCFVDMLCVCRNADYYGDSTSETDACGHPGSARRHHQTRKLHPRASWHVHGHGHARGKSGKYRQRTGFTLASHISSCRGDRWYPVENVCRFKNLIAVFQVNTHLDFMLFL